MTDHRIRTIEELVRALRGAPRGRGYADILSRVDIPTEEFAPWSRWNDKRYTRTCIARTDDFELMLICYEPGQGTSIHDYAAQEAWVRPVVGSVLEERFETTPEGTVRMVREGPLEPGSCSYLHNGLGIHRYSNTGEGRSITLNLYARPLRTWKVYDERSGGSRIERAGGD